MNLSKIKNMELKSMKSSVRSRPSMILEEPSLSVRGNWMQQANQRLLLRMARFTEEDKQRLQEAIQQCRRALIQQKKVSLHTARDNSKIIFNKSRKSKYDITLENSNMHRNSDFTNHNGGANEPSSSNSLEFTNQVDIMNSIRSKFWSYSKKPIRQSLIKFSSSKKNAEKSAIKIFNLIMSYAKHNFKIESDSDSDTCLKATHQTFIIQSLLEKVLANEQLRDEIYLQLIKQTTDNNEMVGTSNLKYWQVLSVVCNVIQPFSQEVTDYLEAHFKICGMDSTTEEGRFSIYCQKCLKRTLEKSPRHFIPSTKEINSLSKRQSIKLHINMLDGTFKKVEVSSHTTNGELIKISKTKIGLKPETEGWSLFEQCGRTEKHCNTKELVTDMIYRWESLFSNRSHQYHQHHHKANLIFKKRIFTENWLNSEDTVETDLLMHQCINDVFEDHLKLGGSITETIESRAAELCAWRVTQECCEPGVGLRVLPQWLRIKVGSESVKLALDSIKSSGGTSSDAATNILRICSNCEPFGALHYPVSQYSVSTWPQDITLSVNRKGLYFSKIMDSNIIYFASFTEIIKLSFQQLGFFIISLKHERLSNLKMFSNVSEDISSIIRDYMIEQSGTNNIDKHNSSSLSFGDSSRNHSSSSSSSASSELSHRLHEFNPSSSHNLGDHPPPPPSLPQRLTSDNDSSLYSLESLSINQANFINQEYEHAEIIEPFTDNMRRPQPIRYLKEYFDSFSVQSDEILDVRESPKSLPLEALMKQQDKSY